MLRDVILVAGLLTAVFAVLSVLAMIGSAPLLLEVLAYGAFVLSAACWLLTPRRR